MISIIIPAYNEQDRLPPTLQLIRPYLDALTEPYELLVVDDGSTDGTVSRANTIAHTWPELRVLELEQNHGKGAAVKLGMLSAKGDICAFTDADLSTPIEEIGTLRKHLSDTTQVVIGSRAVKGSTITVHQPLFRVFMGKTYNLLIRSLVLPGIHDTQCGCKVFTRAAARASFEHLEIERFGFDVESLLRARKAGFGIEEVAVKWHNAEGTRVSSIKDSIQVFLDLLRLRFHRLQDDPM